jgi:hypothetical protein
MMLENYIKQQQKKLENTSLIYTPTGLHIFFQHPVENVNVESVISKVENTVPLHLLENIEMIIFGWFDEFDERDINAFYDEGALYISHIQDNEQDLYDDIVHEIAHSLEEVYSYQIYGDGKLKNEFLNKRKQLHDLMWGFGYKIPLSFFMDAEYSKEFDEFLYEKIGYDKLSTFATGIFISPYGVTSLREYLATGFTEFYLDSNHNFLRKTNPQLYKKIIMLQNPIELDI